MEYILQRAPEGTARSREGMPDGMAWMRPRLERVPGNISCLCKNLATGDVFRYRADAPHEAASVIKLYLMAAMFQGFADGDFRPDDKLPVRREACVPSCGVLTYLDDGKEVSLRDLTELMIIVSDNTACNVLLDFYTLPRAQAFIRDRLGLKNTLFRRKMYDTKRAALGLDNYTTAEDTAWLLEEIWRGHLVSPEASLAMLNMLRHQRLNSKLPFRLHTLDEGPVIAHKTGENDRTTHDVGIIEAPEALLICLMGNETDVPAFEREMADLAWDLVKEEGGFP